MVSRASAANSSRIAAGNPDVSQPNTNTSPAAKAVAWSVRVARVVRAFVIRGRDGQAQWAGGTRRDAAGRVRRFGPEAVRFDARRTWRSPRTGVEYPVAMQVTAGDEVLELTPLLDDQELDSRASVGTIYWEGAVRALRAGAPVGRGYLELTGYGGPLRI